MINTVVYCASSVHIAESYFDAARELGRLMVKEGLQLVCGGGAEGLMAAVIEGANEAGGRPTGILPRFMADRGWAHPSLAKPVITPDMRSRKAALMESAQACITLPGGIGTYEEITELLSFKKLDLWHGPAVILNTDGFYDPLIAQLERMYDQGFANRPAEPLWMVASTPEEAIALIKARV